MPKAFIGHINTNEKKKGGKKKDIPRNETFIHIIIPGGANRSRTGDLAHAMRALYQLSYSPTTLYLGLAV